MLRNQWILPIKARIFSVNEFINCLKNLFQNISIMYEQDLPLFQRIFQELQYFDQKRSKEYLERKKAIELSVIADQLREQSHLVKGAKVHNDQLTKLKENELARKQILKVSHFYLNPLLYFIEY